ncbi:hypothetical protein D3C76_1871610 [compost metagenome]
MQQIRQAFSQLKRGSNGMQRLIEREYRFCAVFEALQRVKQALFISVRFIQV